MEAEIDPKPAKHVLADEHENDPGPTEEPGEAGQKREQGG